MPTGTRPAIGNEAVDCCVYSAAVTFPTIAANASGSNTFAMPGLQVGDAIGWNMQNPPAHLVLDNAYVSAPGVMTILWISDATRISTATVAVLWEIVRPENASLGLSALPANML